jgi:hypothetical protein
MGAGVDVRHLPLEDWDRLYRGRASAGARLRSCSQGRAPRGCTTRALRIAVGAVLLLPGVANAAAPSLARTTSIAGARTGYVQVELPKRLNPFSTNDEPSIKFEGGGAILGVVLRSERTDNGNHTALQILRMDRENEGSPIFYGLGNGENGLPAGPYRLYLIVERPGRVTLEFPSLPAGAVTVAPTVHTPFEAGPLPQRPRPTPGTMRYGRTVELTSDGLVFSRAIIDEAPAGSRLETCVYTYDKEAAAGDRAYGPGCPGGTSGHTETTTSSGPMGAWTISFAASAAPFGHGGNFMTPLPLPTGAVDAFGMWLSYEFPNEVGGPPSPSPSANPHADLAGTATFSARRLEIKSGAARVPLGCSSEGRCLGHVRLSGAIRTVKFDMPAGGERTVKVPLSHSMLRSVSRRRKVRARIVVVSLAGEGRREVKGRVTLVRKRR